MSTRRWLLGIPAGVVTLVVAFLLVVHFAGPRSIIVVHNVDAVAIADCTMRIKSEFETDRTRTFEAMAPGASAVWQTKRLNESSISLKGHYVDGRVIDTEPAGNYWDPSPGDTIRLEVRGQGYSVRWSDRDSSRTEK
jgi:hypothetical protein